MTVSRDATSLRYVPANGSEWAELLSGTGIPNPAHLYLFQEASGNPADSIDGKALTASGTLAYQQAVAGWSRLAIKTTRNAAGKMVNNTFANVNANDYTVQLTASITDIATLTRTVMRLGTTFDDDAALEINATPQLQVGNGGGAARVAGGANPMNAVHYFFLRVGSQIDAFLDTAKIAGGARACNGTELCFGGDNIQTYFPATTFHLYGAVWTSALGDSDLATVVSRLDNGPPSSSSARPIGSPIVRRIG